MKIAASAILGFVLGGILIYFITQPEPPWALATSGSGSHGVSIRGIFGSKEACLIFQELYLKRRESIAESIFKDTKVELHEKAGIVLASEGRWYTASCLPLSGLPNPASDFSGLEDALREIASNVSQ
jgi:hypothetical protein